MSRYNVYLGLGSNLGDRHLVINNAIDQLSTNSDIIVIQQSSLINTVAVSPDSQPDYLNGVCQIKTNLNPLQLLNVTQSIELNLGRDLKGEGQPRTIDIDILLFDDLCIEFENLIIPHPRMHSRYFVLAPLVEIAPHVNHSKFNISINQLYQELQVVV